MSNIQSADNEVTNADIMDFLKEHMVMNGDFEDLKKAVATKDIVATKDDLKKLEVRFDSLEVRFDSLDARLAEMQLELEHIKSRLDDIEQRLKDDADALVLEVQALKKRVLVLEQQLGIQQVAVSV